MIAVFVVDTNVAIVANGGPNIDADNLCQLACIDKIQNIVAQSIIAVDDSQLILKEYAKHLSWSGAPGVGDMFFRYVFDNQHIGDRVRMIALSPSNDERKGFEDLPENSFDPSDRKFLAVAVVSGGVIVNATDSDWDENKVLMERLGVEVEQLCPQYARR